MTNSGYPELSKADKFSLLLSSKNRTENRSSLSMHQISFRLQRSEYLFVKAYAGVTGLTITDVLQDLISIAIEQVQNSEFNELPMDEIIEHYDSEL